MRELALSRNRAQPGSEPGEGPEGKNVIDCWVEEWGLRRESSFRVRVCLGARQPCAELRETTMAATGLGSCLEGGGGCCCGK